MLVHARPAASVHAATRARAARTVCSCHVDVGDDGISIKSGFYDTAPFQLIPSANITIVNTTVLSRNVAIGSACFGGIYNVTMLGGRIGDDEGSSPWAVKVKTHVPYGGVVRGVAFVGVQFGAIAPNSYQQPSGGTAIQVLLEQYGSDDATGAWASAAAHGALAGMPQPALTVIDDISFDAVTVTSAVEAGVFVAQPDPPNDFHITRLSLVNVRFGNITGKAAEPWTCQGVAANTTVAVNVQPPLPAACVAF